MIIAWFSCGATSAVACKIALSLYNDVQVYYIDTGSGHPDNVRFLADCECWYGQPIHTIRSDKYSCVADVLRKGWINSAHGASCTLELKKKVRYKLEKELKEWDGQVWGFDFDPKEINRAIRLLDLAGLVDISLDDIYDFTNEPEYKDWDDALKEMSFTERMFFLTSILTNDGDIAEVIKASIVIIFLNADLLYIDLLWHIDNKIRYNELRENKHEKRY